MKKLALFLVDFVSFSSSNSSENTARLVASEADCPNQSTDFWIVDINLSNGGKWLQLFLSENLK